MMHCTNPKIGRLIARYELGALDATEREKFVGHMIKCDYCHNEVYEMAPFMNVLKDRREEAVRSRVTRRLTPAVAGWRPLWLRWPALAAAVLLAVGGGLLATYLLRQERPPSIAQPSDATTSTPQLAEATPPAWQNLEIPKAHYTPPREKPDLRGGPASAFERAMDAYKRNEFAAAAEQLEAVIRLESDPAEAYFYRGVSLLLLGQYRDAIGCLDRAAQLSVGEQREASHYYSALAYLKNDQPQEALAEFEAVIQLKGLLQVGAEKLKQDILSGRK
jgi:tetratricopeptide (TPR) repeat protein